MSRTQRYEAPKMWRVRDWFRADDITRVHAQTVLARKDWNGNRSTDIDVQNWERRVGVWVD